MNSKYGTYLGSGLSYAKHCRRVADIGAATAAQLEMAALHDYIEELRKDEKRLNFMEESRQGVFTVLEKVRVASTSTDCRWREEWQFCGWAMSSQLEEVPTVREAIDVGMAGGAP